MGTVLPNWLRAAFLWLMRALHLQLFLTLFSLPIIVAWGLPISLASPLGNLIFTPFLTIFLLLASLIFFGELLSLPYEWCAHLLDHVTTWWSFCMDYGDNRWLIGIQRLPLPFLLIIGLAPLAIVACRYTRSLYKSTICFLLLLGSVYGCARLWHLETTLTKIPCGRGNLTLITTAQTTVLIDPGLLGSSTAAASWTRYTLIPHLVSTAGTTHIHHLIMLQPMSLGFEAVEQLCALLRIDTLYLPYWEGQMKKSHLSRYGKLKETTRATQTNIVRTGRTQQKIVLNNDASITIAPNQKKLRTDAITYAAQELTTQIDNQKVTIYSAKHAHATKQAEPIQKSN